LKDETKIKDDGAKKEDAKKKLEQKLPVGTQVRTKKKQQSQSGGPEEDMLKDQTLRAAVKLPPGEDLREWLAVNTVDFYNQINMLYGVLVQRCTNETCPKMSAGPRFEYLWADGKKIKQAIAVSAPEYVEYLMTWVHEQLDDPAIFPSETGVPFPKTFVSVVKQIFKRLFRVYAHIYHCHFPEVVGLKTEAHLNTSFKHLAYFIQEFDLVTPADLTPLQELIDTFLPAAAGGAYTGGGANKEKETTKEKEKDGVKNKEEKS